MDPGALHGRGPKKGSPGPQMGIREVTLETSHSKLNILISGCFIIEVLRGSNQKEK